MIAQNANRRVGFIDTVFSSRAIRVPPPEFARFPLDPRRGNCLRVPHKNNTVVTMAGPGMHQSQNLSLQQVLAPQLQQSLLILQAPLLELRNLVQQEMETNPVLEELPDAPNPDAPAESETPPADDNFKEEFDRLAKLDEEWRDYMSQSQSYSGRSAEEEERRQFFFDSIVGLETLQQHLIEQVNSSDLSAADRQIAELIIGNIDDAGFLQA